MGDMPEAWAKLLRHSLTGGNDVAPYRNYYAASRGHHSEDILLALVERGLMERGHTWGTDGAYYHVTEAGAAAIGLHLPAR